MSQVQASPQLEAALAKAGATVEIIDHTGRLIGVVRSLEGIYVREGDPYDPEEVRAARANPKRYTTEEFFAKLGIE